MLGQLLLFLITMAWPKLGGKLKFIHCLNYYNFSLPLEGNGQWTPSSLTFALEMESEIAMNMANILQVILEQKDKSECGHHDWFF
jgi:hypothetical protein